MITLSLDADDRAILQAIESWLIELSLGRYLEAYELTGHPDDDPVSFEDFKEHFAFQAEENELYHVGLTDLDQLHRELPEHTSIIRPDLNCPPPDTSSGRMIGSAKSLITEMHRQCPDYLGDVDVDLPFDGQWTDISARFALLKHENQMVLYFKDMQVM